MEPNLLCLGFPARSALKPQPKCTALIVNYVIFHAFNPYPEYVCVCVCGGSTESSQKAKRNLKQQIPHKCWEQQVDTD